MRVCVCACVHMFPVISGLELLGLSSVSCDFGGLFAVAYMILTLDY